VGERKIRNHFVVNSLVAEQTQCSLGCELRGTLQCAE
jgi:hypothetical protein